MDGIKNTAVTQAEEEFEVKEDRVFTKDEVNSIIKSRLHGMRKSASKKAEAEYMAKLAELEEKEKLLNAKVLAKENNLPEELAEVLANSTNVDLTLELLKNHVKVEKNNNSTGFQVIGAGRPDGKRGRYDPIREAMGINYDKY